MAKENTFDIRAGHGQQLGANYDGKGVNFALFLLTPSGWSSVCLTLR